MAKIYPVRGNLAVFRVISFPVASKIIAPNGRPFNARITSNYRSSPMILRVVDDREALDHTATNQGDREREKGRE